MTARSWFLSACLVASSAFAWGYFNVFGWQVGKGFGGASVDTLVYDLPLTTDLTAEVGAAPNFTRAASTYAYADTNYNALTEYTSGNPAIITYPEYLPTTNGGLWIGGRHYNQLLQSEAPATTWTTVGSPTSVNNAVGTWGDIAYGSIVAAASGDGITQTTSVAAANNDAVFSLWMQVASGILEVDLTVEGDAGGTPETITKTVYVSSALRRYQMFNNFTASATGNIKVTIAAKAAGTLLLGGMQLEDVTDEGGSSPQIAGPYAKTTTAIARGEQDRLTIDNVVDASAGTIMFWTRLDMPSELSGATVGSGVEGYHVIFGTDSDDLNLIYQWINASGPNLRLFYNGSEVFSNLAASNPTAPAYLPSQKWHHVAVTWEHDGSDVTGNIYINGAFLKTGTITKALPTLTRFALGSYGSFTTASRYVAYAHFGRLKIHNKALIASAIQKEYDDTKANYAQTAYYYGYPASGRQEDQVVAQWLFDEASGNLVDIVGGVSLAAAGATTADYNQSVTGTYANLSPGLLINASSEWYVAGSAQASLNIGTSDATIEFVVTSTESASASRCVFAAQDVTNGRGYLVSVVPNGGSGVDLRLELKAEDDTSTNYNFSNAAINDGEPHKFRITLDRSGNVEGFYDGVSLGTASLSAQSGKTINANDFFLATRPTAGPSFGSQVHLGKYIEMRISVGTFYNNSGGPNGG